jgi:predicted TIM-barrel fold metal-dependent hydrolase
MDEARQLANMGAYIEFLFAHCMPPMLMSPEKMATLIKTLGPEHCIIGTDMGQYFNPPCTEGFHMMLSIMLMFGLSEEQLKIIVKINPAKILGLN